MPHCAKFLAAATLSLFILLPSPALAGDREQAGALFVEGNELRLAGKYKEALDKYNEAYKLLPNFKIEYNTALVLEKLGNHTAAYMTYKSFLKSGEGKSPEKMLDTARQKVKELKQKIALVRVISSVKGATVKFNGLDIGRTPLPDNWEMAVDAPKNVGVWLEAEGYQTFTSSQYLKPGQEVVIRAELKPLNQQAPEPTPAATKSEPESPLPAATVPAPEGDADDQLIQKRRSKTIWAWTTLGLGLACAAGAGVFYGVGYSQVTAAHDEYNELPSTASVSTRDEKWAEVESASKLYIGGHVLAGVAAVAVGVSIYMFVTRPTVQKHDVELKSGVSLSIHANVNHPGLLLRGEF